MNKRDFQGNVEQKAGGIDEACMRYGLGKGTMREIAESCGAIIRIGKRVLVNYTIVDKYLDSISGRK